MTPRQPQISGLVFASDTRELLAVERALSRSRRITVLDVAYDQHALRHRLELAEYDFVILVLDESGKRLPDTIRRFADLPVLVVTVAGDDTSLSVWLQQGAHYVVARDNTVALEHIVSQMIDAAIARRRIDQLQTALTQRATLERQLFACNDDPLILWSREQRCCANAAAMELLSASPPGQGERAGANGNDRPRWRAADAADETALRDDARPTLIPLIDFGLHPPPREGRYSNLPEPVRLDNLSATVLASWITRWLAPQYSSLFRDLEAGRTAPAEVLNRSGKRYRLIAHPVGDAHEQSWLLSFTTLSGSSGLPALETDATTGLPARQSTAALAQRYLDETPTSRRYTALLVSLPSIRVEDGDIGVDRTIEDLMVYRTAARLEAIYDQRTIVGRTSQRQLLVLSRDDKSTSRRHARRIHRILGTLGGLVERTEDIRVDTLTLVGQSWKAIHVIERLEAIASVAESIPDAFEFFDTVEEGEQTLLMGSETIL